MTKEELKALGLTDEQVTKISEDYGKNYVAKSQFNEKNEALKNAEKEKGELSKQIEGLKKNNDSNAELKKQIEAMQAAAKTMETEHATQLAQMKLDAAVERSLTAAKAKNIKAARALLDLKDARLDEKGKSLDFPTKLKSCRNQTRICLMSWINRKRSRWHPSRIRFRRWRCGKTDCAAAI